jgi:hypothetical protein
MLPLVGQIRVSERWQHVHLKNWINPQMVCKSIEQYLRKYLLIHQKIKYLLNGQYFVACCSQICEFGFFAR